VTREVTHEEVLAWLRDQLAAIQTAIGFLEGRRPQNEHGAPQRPPRAPSGASGNGTAAPRGGKRGGEGRSPSGHELDQVRNSLGALKKAGKLTRTGHTWEMVTS
jgi:hypothetical protein